MRDNTTEIHFRRAEPWRVTVVDTGTETMTGGRLKRVAKFIGDETFCFTYGDGVGDVNIQQLIEFHLKHGKMATLTSVQPPGRYGTLEVLSSAQVGSFREKPVGEGAWINGGFFVLEPSAINRVTNGDVTVWEREPLESLAADGELFAYRHEGFWRPMDTLRDKNELESLWEQGRAPWKVWA